jgi:hypothetical protein
MTRTEMHYTAAMSHDALQFAYDHNNYLTTAGLACICPRMRCKTGFCQVILTALDFENVAAHICCQLASNPVGT